jgi:hypothetical protein
MNYPSFLSEPQIEELEEFGMIELTEELCDSFRHDSDETPFYIDDLYDDGEALVQDTERMKIMVFMVIEVF